MTMLVFGAVAALIAVLQTTWLAGLSIAGVRPDLALSVLAYGAHLTGVQRGQITGFAVGLVEDAVSVAPLGFHAVTRLAHSAVAGMTHGAVRADPLVMPAALGLVGTVVKILAGTLLAAIAGLRPVLPPVFSIETAIQIGLNTVVTPVIFAVLRPVARRLARRSGEL